MIKENISKFLEIRESRLSDIEIANKLYIEIGNTLSSITRQKFSSNPHIDGCIYQFFAYTQRQVLIHFMFTNFITIIGSCTKKGQLKSWAEFNLTEEILDLLKEIRARYSEIRNNLLAHISTSFELNEAHAVPTAQIDEDIKHLRDILNTIRQANRIPIMIQGYDPDKHHAVEGLRKLFKKLGLRSLDTCMK